MFKDQELKQLYVLLDQVTVTQEQSRKVVTPLQDKIKDELGLEEPVAEVSEEDEEEA